MALTTNVTVEDTTTLIVDVHQGIQGPAGPSGPNSVTSATTSDGTASLSISDLQTATATVSGTLTANHIHGNLAGSVYSHVRAGENLSKGDPVYISGSHGSGANLIPIVSRAQSGNSSKMPAVGVMDSALSANATGHMVIVGTITDLNTNAYPVNSTLYVGDSGGLIDSGGISGFGNIANLQAVARVERQNTNNGAIIVKVNGVGSNGGYGPSDSNKNAIFNIDGSLHARSDGIALYATTTEGIGVYAYAEDDGIGLTATSEVGTYHATFGGDGNDRSAIERVRGWFVWFYSTFVGRLKTADITANRDWTLPNATGELMLKEENLSGLANQGTSRTNLGAGTTGSSLFTASTVDNAKSTLGIERKTRLADDTVATTGRVALSGMTFDLAASTWYKLEVAYRFTSTGGSGLRYFLETTGSFATEGASPGGLGAAMQNAAISSSFQSTTTLISLRGNTTTNADNQRGFAVAYFKTNASGTGSISIALNTGTSTGTNHEIVAVLSTF